MLNNLEVLKQGELEELKQFPIVFRVRPSKHDLFNNELEFLANKVFAFARKHEITMGKWYAEYSDNELFELFMFVYPRYHDIARLKYTKATLEHLFNSMLRRKLFGSYEVMDNTVGGEFNE